MATASAELYFECLTCLLASGSYPLGLTHAAHAGRYCGAHAHLDRLDSIARADWSQKRCSPIQKVAVQGLTEAKAATENEQNTRWEMTDGSGWTSPPNAGDTKTRTIGSVAERWHALVGTLEGNGYEA